MSNQAKRPRRAHGPMGGMGAGEKAKNFKGTMKQLWKYLSRYWVALLLTVLFAVGSTVFAIIGPKILGTLPRNCLPA